MNRQRLRLPVRSRLYARRCIGSRWGRHVPNVASQQARSAQLTAGLTRVRMGARISSDPTRRLISGAGCPRAAHGRQPRRAVHRDGAAVGLQGPHAGAAQGAAGPAAGGAVQVGWGAWGCEVWLKAWGESGGGCHRAAGPAAGDAVQVGWGACTTEVLGCCGQRCRVR